jgi:hypothetical protein
MILTNTELLEMDIQAGYWKANLMHIYSKLGTLEALYSQENKCPYCISIMMENRRKLRHND